MSKGIGVLLVVVLALSSVLLFFPVEAQTEGRTIVVPDDYPTISVALTNAEDGDTIFVKRGTYREHSFVIDKSITLVGEDVGNTRIVNIDQTPELDRSKHFLPPFPPAVVQINADNVKLSGFSINTSYSSYVRINVHATRVEITDNIIENSYVKVNGNNNTIAQSSLGYAYVELKGQYNCVLHNQWSTNTSVLESVSIVGSYNLVYGNTVTDDGTRLSSIKIGGDNNIVAKNTLACDFSIVASGSNNWIFANHLLKSGALVILSDFNLIFANQVENGNIVIDSHTFNNTVYNNNFINTQVSTNLDVYGLNYFDNGREGNYWSDYTGVDADGDGIGDTPYIIEYPNENRKDNYPLMTPFDLSTIDIELTEWTPLNLDIPRFNPDLPPTITTLNMAIAVTAIATAIATAIVAIGLPLYLKRTKQNR